MKKILLIGLAAAVIAVGFYYSVIPAETRSLAAIPKGGVLQMEDAVENGFQEAASEFTVSVIETEPKVEPYSAAYAGDELFFLGKGLVNDRYDGTVGLYKVTESIDEAMEGGHVEAVVLDEADLQKNEWTDLYSLGDVLIWDKSHRVSWDEYDVEKAGYHRDSGYVELPLALQLHPDCNLMRYGDRLYWFEGAEIQSELMTWKEGFSKSESLAEDVFRPYSKGGVLDCGLLAYNKGGDCIIRMDLEENLPLDKFSIAGKAGVENVFCNEDYITWRDYDGNLFCYKTAENRTYLMKVTENPFSIIIPEMHLSGDHLVYAEENRLAVYNLETMTVQTAELPEMKYTDFIYTEGQILACSNDGRCFVKIAYS